MKQSAKVNHESIFWKLNGRIIDRTVDSNQYFFALIILFEFHINFFIYSDTKGILGDKFLCFMRKYLNEPTLKRL